MSITTVVLDHDEAARLAPPGGKAPPPRVVAELVERSMGVSLRGVTRELIRLGDEPSWSDVPALRFARMVRLAPDGTAPLGDRWVVRRDERLGVCFDRTGTAPSLTIEEEEE